MTGDKKGEQKKKSTLSKAGPFLILLALCLAAFLAGYGLMASGAGEKIGGMFKQWLGIEHTVSPPEEDPKDPGEEPRDPGEETQEPGSDPQEPGEEPQEPGNDPQEPGEEPGGGDEQPGDPIIYAGQVLTIPLPGGGGSSSVSQVIQRGVVSAGQKQIALTFDSGWLYEQTIPLLDTLDSYGVKATFFPRAYWLSDFPDLGREIARRGHTVGNHSLTHPHMNEMTAEQMRHEIKESTRITREITGVRPYLFRPPFGEYSRRLLEILAEEGYPYTIMWTVDTLDWAAGTTYPVGGKQVYIDTDFIVNRVLNNASDNGIILMHIGGSYTVEALPRIIEGLKDMGYAFTTVDKMLPPPDGGTVTHTVQSGETLYSIAKRYGATVAQLIEANDL